MRPCDCKSYEETKKYLKEQGLAFNNCSIMVRPNVVYIENGPATIKIPMRHFKAFAEWYLGDQEKPEELGINCPPVCPKCGKLHYLDEHCDIKHYEEFK